MSGRILLSLAFSKVQSLSSPCFKVCFSLLLRAQLCLVCGRGGCLPGSAEGSVMLWFRACSEKEQWVEEVCDFLNLCEINVVRVFFPVPG